MQTIRSWWSDRLLRNVLTNSSYLFSSNAATIVLGMLQGILAARTLGAERFGILSATVIPFVSMVSRLTSFRMSELVVKYMGQYLAEEKKDLAAAVAKAAVIADLLVSLLSYGILLLVAPLAATYLAKDPQTTPLFLLYGIILLGNATFESATGVLQATNQFRTIALVNFGQSLITVSLILFANLTGGGINEVLFAYLMGKLFAGIALSTIAFPACPHPGPWLVAGLAADHPRPPGPGPVCRKYQPERYGQPGHPRQRDSVDFLLPFTDRSRVLPHRPGRHQPGDAAHPALYRHHLRRDRQDHRPKEMGGDHRLA